MSLNFDYSKIVDNERVTTHPDDIGKDPTKEKVRYHSVFNSMVWNLMIIGVGRINEKTLPTVQARMAQYQKALGAALSDHDGRDIYITDEDLAKMVGLSTNVSDMTDAQWAKHLIGMIDREAGHIRKSDRIISAYEMEDWLTFVLEDGQHYIR